MKKNLFLLTSALLMSVTLSAQRVYENADYGIFKIEDRTWMINCYDAPNFGTLYIMEGDDKALVIDTAMGFEDLTSVIRKVTQKPLVLAMTHMHGDHVGSIHEFDNIHLHKGDETLGQRALSRFTGETNFLTDGQVFDLGGRQIEVKFTPGHTAGCVIFIDYSKKLCFSGDSFGSGQVWLQMSASDTPISDYATLTSDMLSLMASRNIHYIYCGHYGQVNGVLGITYIQEMNTLANMLLTGEAETVKHDRSSETSNTMMATFRGATIVFNPDKIR